MGEFQAPATIIETNDDAIQCEEGAFYTMSTLDSFLTEYETRWKHFLQEVGINNLRDLVEYNDIKLN